MRATNKVCKQKRMINQPKEDEDDLRFRIRAEATHQTVHEHAQRECKLYRT